MIKLPDVFRPEKDSEKKIEELLKPDIKPDLELLIDDVSADNGSYKIQDNWTEYWDKIYDGRVMMSTSDFYIAVKQLRKDFEYGSKSDKYLAESIVEGWKKELKRVPFASSTRLNFDVDKTDFRKGRIVHHYNETDKALIKNIVLEIPFYGSGIIEDVLSKDEGLNYIQAYFDTDDNAEVILKNLEFITDRKQENLLVWTPEFYTRGLNPVRAAFLFYGFNSISFNVYGTAYPDYNAGFSRGVRFIKHENRETKQ